MAWVIYMGKDKKFISIRDDSILEKKAWPGIQWK
jgi:hypothetical protein